MSVRSSLFLFVFFALLGAFSVWRWGFILETALVFVVALFELQAAALLQHFNWRLQALENKLEQKRLDHLQMSHWEQTPPEEG